MTKTSRFGFEAGQLFLRLRFYFLRIVWYDVTHE